MLLHHLKLHNFMIFHGTHRIDFAYEEANDSNITLILAANNSGKTSIIRSLRFLLYDFETEAQKEKAVNLEAIRLASPNALIHTSVEAKFSIKHQHYTVRRAIVGTRNGPMENGVHIGDQRVVLYRHERERDDIKSDADYIDAFLKGLIPPRLFDFFFFEGEELATKILSPERDKQTVREALEEILYRDKWGEVIDTLKKVSRSFARQLKESQGQTQQFKQLKALQAHLLNKRDDLMKEHTSSEKKVQESKVRYEELNNQVLNIKSGKNRQINDKIKDRRAEQKRAEQVVADYETQLQDALGKSGGLFFLGTAFKQARKVLEGMEQRRILPPEVTANFIDRLLKENKCLCGTELTMGSTERKQVEEFKKISLSRNVNLDLYALLGKLQADIQVGLPKGREELFKNVERLASKTDAARNHLVAMEDEIKNLERQYDKDIDKRLSEFLMKRANAESEKEKAIYKHASIEGELKELQRELGDVMRKLESVNDLPKEARILVDCEKLGNKLAGLVDQVIAELHDSFHKFLQQHVADVYDKIVSDGSKAVIESNSLLPSIKRGGGGGFALGGGQSQTLCLAYIIALSELRKRVNMDLSQHFRLCQVDDQCFFMDSVFGPMEAPYRSKITKALPDRMRQLVILVATQQWDESIQKGLKGHINKLYYFVLHSPSAPDEYVDFFGKSLPLVKKDLSEIQAHSEIKEAKV